MLRLAHYDDDLDREEEQGRLAVAVTVALAKEQRVLDAIRVTAPREDSDAALMPGYEDRGRAVNALNMLVDARREVEDAAGKLRAFQIRVHDEDRKA